MGARPMARLIQDKIRKPLAEEILFGKLEGGGHVYVTLKDGEPHFECEPRKASDPETASPSGGSETAPVG
jgi:ATP-dependent Clp protease ATP-binding subunit ClpA